MGEGAAVPAGVGDGVSVAAGDSVGPGVEDTFLCFDFVFDVGLGDGVGEDFFGFGEAVGDGVGVAFLAERFLCLRLGAGVGVGSKAFLIFVPKDSSAASAAWIVPSNIATTRSHFIKQSVATKKIVAQRFNAWLLR